MIWLLIVYVVVIILVCILAGYAKYRVTDGDVLMLFIWPVILVLLPHTP